VEVGHELEKREKGEKRGNEGWEERKSIREK